jgi:hypothetical protein
MVWPSIEQIKANPEGIGRHPALLNKMGFFEFDHLKPGPLQEISKRFHDLAWELFADTRVEGEQLALGMQKLIEAKDCLVRAGLGLPRKNW